MQQETPVCHKSADQEILTENASSLKIGEESSEKVSNPVCEQVCETRDCKSDSKADQDLNQKKKRRSRRKDQKDTDEDEKKKDTDEKKTQSRRKNTEAKKPVRQRKDPDGQKPMRKRKDADAKKPVKRIGKKSIPQDEMDLEMQMSRDQQGLKTQLDEKQRLLQDANQCHGYLHCTCLCHYYSIPTCRCGKELKMLLHRVHDMSPKRIDEMIFEKRLRDRQRLVRRIRSNAAARARYRDRHWQ